ncbi:MAG: carotenoid 1,2-hydratase [Deltaproteobacteria bacterium]|nr:carotenoid 1,2-hydratase [Deltaproteobacteria bacterium]
MTRYNQRILSCLMVFSSFFFILHFVKPAKAAEGFKKAQPGYEWSFPRDHGAHLEFQTEWWYFTGHFQDEQGRQFGFQWTVFRRALRPLTQQLKEKEGLNQKSAWRTNQLYLGHLALSDLSEKKFYYFESIQRGVLALAGASENELKVWLPQMKAETLNSHILSLRGEGKKANSQLLIKLELELPEHPLLHGDQGFSAKGAEKDEKGQVNGSYYYSYTHLPTKGSLQLDGKRVDVTGQAWMDHEFSSSTLSKTQIGWDWLSLPLKNGAALMLFRVRDERGSQYDYYSGTYLDTLGNSHALKREDIKWIAKKVWQSPQSGAKYPVEWSLKISRFDLNVKLKAHFNHQELITQKSAQVVYWEGSVEAKIQHQGKQYQSDAYLEMTGYARKFEQQI